MRTSSGPGSRTSTSPYLEHLGPAVRTDADGLALSCSSPWWQWPAPAAASIGSGQRYMPVEHERGPGDLPAADGLAEKDIGERRWSPPGPPSPASDVWPAPMRSTAIIVREHRQHRAEEAVDQRQPVDRCRLAQRSERIQQRELDAHRDAWIRTSRRTSAGSRRRARTSSPRHHQVDGIADRAAEDEQRRAVARRAAVERTSCRNTSRMPPVRERERHKSSRPKRLPRNSADISSTSVGFR